MVGALGQNGPGKKDELPNSTGFPALLPLREAEMFDGLRTDIAAGGVHYEDDFFALIHKVFNNCPNGLNVGGKILDIGTVGTGAGEGDCFGSVVVGRGEGVDDLGEDGDTFPEARNEDEGWFLFRWFFHY